MSRPTLAVITDEIGVTLDEVLDFAQEEAVRHIEIRQLDGANFLSLDADHWRRAADRFAAAGITIAGLATPLLKWPPPGRPFTLTGDQFGFDPASAPFEAHAARVVEAGEIFGAGNIRIFSYLAADDFLPSELDAPYAHLLDLAVRHRMVLQLENEPVCNVRTVEEGAAAVARTAHPRLRLLLDIANAVQIGAAPSLASIEDAMARVDYIHVKDWSAARGRFVPVGEGDIDWPASLAAIRRGAGGRPLTISLETHCHGERPAATRTSWRRLRRMVDEVWGA